MPAAVVVNGVVKQLDGRTQTAGSTTAKDVQDPEVLAQTIGEMLDDLAALKRRFDPRVLYFRDQVVDATGATKYRFPHGFGGRVNYEIAYWSGAAAPNLRADAATDANTLVLTSTSAGTVTVRVEEAG